MATRIISSEESNARTLAPASASRRDVTPFPQATSSRTSRGCGRRSFSTLGQTSELKKSFPSAIRSSQNRALVSQASRALTFSASSFDILCSVRLFDGTRYSNTRAAVAVYRGAQLDSVYSKDFHWQ